MLTEIVARLQAIEDALRQREESFTRGINTFTETVVLTLVEEWQQTLREMKREQEEQEKRYLAAMKLLLEQTVQTAEKTDSGQPPSWLCRLFDSKNRA
jgi:CRISPR/Cas system CMR subunit Cmr6 (Cas7 group RAMP superfamily)